MPQWKNIAKGIQQWLYFMIPMRCGSMIIRNPKWQEILAVLWFQEEYRCLAVGVWVWISMDTKRKKLFNIWNGYAVNITAFRYLYSEDQPSEKAFIRGRIWKKFIRGKSRFRKVMKKAENGVFSPMLKDYQQNELYTRIIPHEINRILYGEISEEEALINMEKHIKSKIMTPANG